MQPDIDHQIVKPVPNVFTFVGDTGKDLRDIVIELNNQWSFYMVKRIGDDAQLDALNDTLSAVKEEGVDRDSMAAVESLRIQPLDSRYPVHSYTLKRSKTQQKVACEEIGKQILSVIKSTVTSMIKWIKERIAAVVKIFKDLLKSKSAAERDALLEKIEKFGTDFKYRDLSELQNDSKVTAHAENMKSHYTRFIDRVLNDDKTINALGALIKDPRPVFEYIDNTAEIVSTLLKDVILGKSVSESKETPALHWPALDAFLKPFSTEGTLQNKTLEATAYFRDEQGEPADIDPFNFPELAKLVRKLMLNLTVGQSPYLFSDEDTDRVVSTAEKVNSMLDAVDKLVDQVRSGDRDRESVRPVRDAAQRLSEGFSVLQMIGQFSDQFSKITEQWLKIIYLQMVNCRVTESTAEE